MQGILILFLVLCFIPALILRRLQRRQVSSSYKGTIKFRSACSGLSYQETNFEGVGEGREGGGEEGLAHHLWTNANGRLGYTPIVTY